MALLSFEGVAKRYGRGRLETVVLEGVWWDVHPGNFVGVWGDRRAGKTTLLQLAAGIVAADRGVVRFDGRDLAGLAAVDRARLLRDQIGFACAPLEGLWEAGRRKRVVEHVALPLLSAGWAGRDAGVVARQALQGVGASRCADLRTDELSMGERTRVALARALIRQPRLLLVDEPAGTPSMSEQDEIRELLLSLTRSSELTLIVASEEPAMLRGATRVVSVGDGRLLTSERSGTVVEFPAGAAVGGG